MQRWVVCALIVLLVNARRCDVRNFGARGDNKTDDTPALRAAIRACAGGGVVALPAPGRYLSGAFNLTDHQVLEVATGAWLVGSARPADYPAVASFPSYKGSRDVPNSTCRHGALVGAVGAQNVTLTGGGVVDGQGALYWWPAYDAHQLGCSRPRLVEFERCSGVVVRDLTLQNSPFWTVHFIYSDNIVAERVTVLAPTTRGNTDGINPDSSTNVLIKDCYIRNGDDGIAIKSGLDRPGREVGRPTVNVTIINVTTSGSGGIAIGSEMSGGVQNVTIADVKCLGQQTVHIKTTKGRGGYVRNINFVNLSQNVQLVPSFGSGNAPGPWPAIADLHFFNCPSCSLSCGKIPNPAYCNPASFTFNHSCGLWL